ncbi:MAG: FAD-dependent monooxygenase [Chryseobacterium sp.]|uniref:FAD-dependent oxidoreductase n=1 Tax=Chryseobacterium sp. TaxID=1871047 RepID=UPI0025B7F351|nr:FAD-dependent monooxygenase [Chryseobacterium sp.]MCJ7932643.1 FAD-dependent monooxygenase [Chryseobacterium sp.]
MGIYWKSGSFWITFSRFLPLFGGGDLLLYSGAIRQWHPELRALFEHADRTSLSATAIRSSLPKEKWKSGRITALGDAVHTMSPAGGAVANTAFMDAALLTENICKALKDNSSIVLAVAHYEEKMRVYNNQAIEISLRGGEILHGSNES